MTRPPNLTDRAQLARNRARSIEDALFLHILAADQIEERLDEVNRTFTDVAIVTGHTAFWSARFPEARIVVDEDRLDLAPEAHDLIIHAMALHWADDPVGQIVQCRRALRPDGLFLGICLGGRTLNELRAALARAETSVRGGLSPRVAPMAEIRDLGALVQRAGLAQPVADSDLHRVRYRDLRHLMADLRAMGEGNALAARDRRSLSRPLLAEAERLYAAEHSDGDRVVATFEQIFLSGWSPHASQQKPLRPGSAKMRLSDALGGDETALPDTTAPSRD